MTINEAIGWANAAIAAGLIILGCVFFHQAWQRGVLWERPPSALVMLGIVPLAVGMVLAQIAIFRLGDIGYPFGANDWGTLCMRLVAVVIVAAKALRVVQGRLLTPADRTRLDGGSG